MVLQMEPLKLNQPQIQKDVKVVTPSSEQKVSNNQINKDIKLILTL